MPVPPRTWDHHRSPLRRRSPLLRYRVWRSALGLDIELAAGAHPSSSPELALRTEQLLRRHHRSRLAEQLAEMARTLPDREMAEEMQALAVRVSRVDDRDVVPVATASRLVQEHRFESSQADYHPRPDEARLLLLRRP